MSDQFVVFYRLTPQLVIRSAWWPFWPRPGEQVLVVRARRAFPPSHPSTHLCLELLAAALQEQPVTRLLDVGCGSGILALATARLGVPFNVGVDLSAKAIQAARDNARRNRLTAAVHWLRGSTEALRGSFELIVANLPWAVQRDKVAELQRLAAPRGRLILSGFRDTQEKSVLSDYQDHGWQLEQRRTRDRWEIELPTERSYTWVGFCLRRGEKKRERFPFLQMA